MSDFDTSNLDIFLGDFGITVTATSWGTEIKGIFDVEYVEYEQISRESPTLLVKTSDVKSTRDSGDLFTVAGESFQLVDVQYAEPGLTRLILAEV